VTHTFLTVTLSFCTVSEPVIFRSWIVCPLEDDVTEPDAGNAEHVTAVFGVQPIDACKVASQYGPTPPSPTAPVVPVHAAGVVQA
jgi:hypothetical protein